LSFPFSRTGTGGGRERARNHDFAWLFRHSHLARKSWHHVHPTQRRSLETIVPNPLRRSQRGSPMPTPAETRATFRKLHAQGGFVIPNPWDVGSARYLQGLGFKALATTSAGFAFAQGLPDGGVPRAMMLTHYREIVAATDVPVNADFEGGFADE